MKQKKDHRFSSANWRTTKSSAFAKMQKGLAPLNRCIFLRSRIGFSSRVVAMRHVKIVYKITPHF
ncbi:MAG: hypothetical protein U5N56_08820 [Candidatus Marinimicrobia bacterium]|nr:hypothetical protein [Candidatus Neomarinimicrobiota bacterium]